MNSIKDKKIVITGAAGFIGSHLCSRLLDNGANVTAMVHYNSLSSLGNLEFLAEEELKKLNTIKGNIEDPFFVNKNLSGFDIVFHLAALARIQPSFKNPQEVFEVNTLGTQNVLDYARERNIPVVYAGSSSTHGDHYANPYTFTKWQGELLCEMYNRVFNLPTTICRFYNVHQPFMCSYFILVSSIFIHMW